MHTRRHGWFLLAALTAFAAVMPVGCGTYSRPTAPAEDLTPRQRQFEALWEASLDVLRRGGWEIEFQDRRSGRIVTNAIVSRMSWEFWRRDTSSFADLLENDLHKTYRTVELQVLPAETPATAASAPATAPSGEATAGWAFAPVARVLVARSNNRPAQVTISAQAYQLYGGSRSTYRVEVGEESDFDRAMAVGENAGVRTSLPDDKVLARRLQQRILDLAHSRLH